MTEPFLFEGAQFSCAPWTKVSIFEGISGVFQDAHFRERVRTFEPGAHLRRQNAALESVPLKRKVAQPLASVLIAGRRIASIHEFTTDTRQNDPHTLPQALRRLSRFARMREAPAGKDK